MSSRSTLAVSIHDGGIWRNDALVPLLDAPLERVWPLFGPSERARAFVGWGRRPSGERAAALAEKYGLPCLRLEDGFLRSVGLGQAEPTLSLVVDDLGIYYDATGPSRLEAMIVAEQGGAERARARALAETWRRERLSKYNHGRDEPPPIDGPFVLVVDQTFGDASIRYGLGSPESFSRMLEAALDEHPGLQVVLKVHPEVIAGRKRGNFGPLTSAQRERVTLLGSSAHVAPLLEAAHAVYVVTSQVGFEALLWDKPVRCFGMPFYAGWGLTDDDLTAPERRRPVTLEQLTHAALVDYPRYVDPETGERTSPERLASWIGLQRRMRGRFPEEVFAAGFTRWKEPILRDFLGGSEVRYVERACEVPDGATLVVWGHKDVGPNEGRDVVRVEDGFIRSVGLGAAHVRPLSWSMHRVGVRKTPPLALEDVLRDGCFDEALLERARALRARILGSGVTKYNVGGGEVRRPDGARRVVLVPGQVESDASIAYGSREVKTNLALLRAARAAAPDAHLIYKPHPDVVGGYREAGEADRGEAGEIADQVIVGAHMAQLLDVVDELHVITSLSGFEALLREKKVVTYGQPFYAGWGLTEDRDPPHERGRVLTLDELVAGVLILAPTYVSRVTHKFTTPERALEELVAWRAEGPKRAV